MSATSRVRARLRSVRITIVIVIALFASFAFVVASPTQATAQTAIQTASAGVLPIEDKTFNFGGKLYNGSDREVWFVRNYPDPTGLQSYAGVTYSPWWYSVGGILNSDGTGRPVRMSIGVGQWSPGAWNADLAPYNRYPSYVDVDGVWIPGRHMAEIRTESLWPSCWCYRTSTRWWLAGGQLGRWYKLWGPTTARGGRYYMGTIRPYAWYGEGPEGP